MLHGEVLDRSGGIGLLDQLKAPVVHFAFEVIQASAPVLGDLYGEAKDGPDRREVGLDRGLDLAIRSPPMQRLLFEQVRALVPGSP